MPSPGAPTALPCIVAAGAAALRGLGGDRSGHEGWMDTDELKWTLIRFGGSLRANDAVDRKPRHDVRLTSAFSLRASSRLARRSLATSRSRPTSAARPLLSRESGGRPTSPATRALREVAVGRRGGGGCAFAWSSRSSRCCSPAAAGGSRRRIGGCACVLEVSDTDARCEAAPANGPTRAGDGPRLRCRGALSLRSSERAGDVPRR